jgi:hypothetical protein
MNIYTKYCFDIYDDYISVLKGIMKKHKVNEAYLVGLSKSSQDRVSHQVTLYSKDLNIDEFMSDCDLFGIKGPPGFDQIRALTCQKLLAEDE